MICSDDEALADNARFLATQARDAAPYYLHSTIGFNYRLSNVLAAIGIGQLEVLDDRVAARRRVLAYYREHLSDLPGITFMPEAAFAQSNCWLTTIRIDPAQFGASCEEVRLALESENIEARRVWKPLHTQPVFRGYRRRGGAVAEEIFDTALSLPSGSAMTEQDLRRVVDAIRAVRLSPPA
jgi:pyridoxal phosphate-dependent aminotransferase EpsN